MDELQPVLCWVIAVDEPGTVIGKFLAANSSAPACEYCFLCRTGAEMNDGDLLAVKNSSKVVISSEPNNIAENLSQLLDKTSAAYYWFQQGTDNNEYSIGEIVRRIAEVGLHDHDVIVFRSHGDSYRQYSRLEEVPSLLHDADISHMVFHRNLLAKLSREIHSANRQYDPYEWKARALLSADWIHVYPLSRQPLLQIPSIGDEPSDSRILTQIETAIHQFTEEFSSFVENVGRLHINKYIRMELIANYCEELMSGYIGPLYQEVLSRRNRKEQSVMLTLIYRWLNTLDKRTLNSVPSIPYYFVRNTIDRYLSLSWSTRRKHLRILTHILTNMHYNVFQEYRSRHNHLYPAAMAAARWKSTLPIFLYLLRRKLKARRADESSNGVRGYSV
ncbi:hypothetical protein [Alicyclobacillus kakegawensis]|uniref:hypothetical protein n=1 Tax=Alicyclobacillus kakegawensis TaxID=392012 RepID=UPI000A6C99A0|nr:hypothetical protein [Alicyclobacillus kakegawensis]